MGNGEEVNGYLLRSKILTTIWICKLVRDSFCDFLRNGYNIEVYLIQFIPCFMTDKKTVFPSRKVFLN
jgi:hypothetical protein